MTFLTNAISFPKDLFRAITDDFAGWAKRQVVELPHSFTAYMIPYIRDEIYNLQDGKIGRNGKFAEWAKSNPPLDDESFRQYVRRGYNKVMLSPQGFKDAMEYTAKRHYERLLNKSKFDSLHHSATMQGSVNADDDSWFNILRMGGAVTTTATGTSALFNNKTGGGKRRGKKKKKREKDQGRYLQNK
jgi:hypothetical protein|tara:strand:+ start:204 stop:764 length:561 start_codon:yes stop_codon:yes gene_type:complete